MSVLRLNAQKPAVVVFESSVVIFYIMPAFLTLLHTLLHALQYYSPLLLSLLLIFAFALSIPMLSILLVDWLSQKIEVSLELTV